MCSRLRMTAKKLLVRKLLKRVSHKNGLALIPME